VQNQKKVTRLLSQLARTKAAGEVNSLCQKTAAYRWQILRSVTVNHHGNNQVKLERREAPMHISKAVYGSKSGKPTCASVLEEKDGKMVRVYVKLGRKSMADQHVARMRNMTRGNRQGHARKFSYQPHGSATFLRSH
jgi:hypothetical protein